MAATAPGERLRMLITGAGGLLGRAMVEGAQGCGDGDVVALPRAALDITDPSAVAAVLADVRPGVVVNCAGYTHVDHAEREIAAALAANTVGPAVLAAETSRWESVLIHISTDHVFAGTAGEPYREDDPTGPPNCYGRTKEQGEAWVRALQPRHYVVRTAGLFGSGGRNFVAAILARAERGEPVRVVADQVCQRTYAPDLAGALWQLVHSEVPFGTYHLTNQGAGSWYEFAGDLVEAAGCDLRPTPVSSAAWGAEAPRPAYSVLSDAKWRAAGLRPLRPLMEAVREYLCRRPQEKAQ